MKRKIMRKPARVAIEAALLAVLVAALLWPASVEMLSPLWRSVFDAVHFPVFLLAAILLYRGFSREKLSGTRALLAFFGGLLLAGIVEGTQSLLGRQASVEDFMRGSGGAAMGALGCFLFSGSQRGVWGYGVAVLVIGILEFVPAGRLFLAVRHQQSQFPVLGDFEEPGELLLWTPQGVNGWGEVSTIDRNKAFASRGKHALRVKTSGGPGYAGVSCDMGGQDWKGYETLAWEIWNPGETFTLGVRIDDDGDVSTAESRYGTSVEVKRGENAYAISLEEVRTGAKTRLVNLGAIRRILFYTDDNSPPHVFFVDGLRLERAESGEPRAEDGE